MSKIIKNHFQNIINTLNKTKIDIKIIIKISEKLISSIKSKKKIFVYGNGGSFADSSHFVGELTATYKKKRKAFPFYLLGSNMASVSAWANDFEFNDYVSRELSGYSIRNDVLIILSTSGGNIKQNQSLNLIKLAKNAKSKGVFIISLLGKGGGEVSKISDLSIIVDSNTTSTIQEMHKIILHSICEYIDSKKI